MTKKEELIKYIDEAAMTINDSFTFTWLRLTKYELVERYGLGGGNVLQLLAAFANLNLISKVYYLLNKKLDLEKATKEREQVVEKIDSLQLTNKEQEWIEIKPVDKINEVGAFIKFITWYNEFAPDNKLGLRHEDDMRVAWKKVRNALSHMGFLSMFSQAKAIVPEDKESIDISKEEVLAALDANFKDPAFRIARTGGIEAALSATDIVVLEVNKTIQAIKQYINNLTDDQLLDQTISWVKRYTY